MLSRQRAGGDSTFSPHVAHNSKTALVLSCRSKCPAPHGHEGNGTLIGHRSPFANTKQEKDTLSTKWDSNMANQVKIPPRPEPLLYVNYKNVPMNMADIFDDLYFILQLYVGYVAAGPCPYNGHHLVSRFVTNSFL